MTLGPLSVEILPVKKDNIFLSSHFPLSIFLALAPAGEEEGGTGSVEFGCVIYW
jgi:hypothetical protein